jgi:uncharacterized protein YgbK (DUF1537 family)
VGNRINTRQFLDELPAEWPVDLLPEIQQRVRDERRKIVVLDDDPTGTQTVHSVPVLTEWTVSALCAEFANDLPAFFVLTNSRSLSLADAQALNRAVGAHLRQAAQQTGREFTVISRSDSTLRGHFPGEVQALAGALETNFDSWLIIPFFLEGGRYTIDNVHYVDEGGWWIPAGETPYAQDPVFGYRASNLTAWIEEKTGVSAAEVAAISIDDIRRGGPTRVAARLLALPHGALCVINAVSYRDLEVVVAGILEAEAQGRQFLYRTAASFARVRAGIASRPLLSKFDLGELSAGGGLFFVGSYVPKTTGQVMALLALPDMAGIEVEVALLLDDDRRDQEIARAADVANATLAYGADAVIYTSRRLITGDNISSLTIGKHISEGLVSIVRAIHARPRYLVAKGGITASDIATQGLLVRRALVLGQILPGVPVWQPGTESRYPGMPYIVFPGNVGGPEALVEIAARLA